MFLAVSTAHGQYWNLMLYKHISCLQSAILHNHLGFCAAHKEMGLLDQINTVFASKSMSNSNLLKKVSSGLVKQRIKLALRTTTEPTNLCVCHRLVVLVL
jgi:hypothetical protein